MCGIVGIVNLRGISRSAAEPRLQRALSRLAPRGPDGVGTWFGDQSALGHRRLAVIDLSAAASQPMHRGPLTIVFNGEIYNYRTLRAELENLGHRFMTKSDTETILAGYQQWREGIVARLSGMFALAIWDAERHELFAARDAFGKKPFLYRHVGPSFTFASDLIALEHAADEKLPLDPQALRWLFALRYIPEPLAAVQGVAKLPPGHYLRFSAGGLSVARWHSGPSAPRHLERPGDELEALVSSVDDAVRARLIADVPVGVFLSGGIDSAIVAASVARQVERPRTFTVGFEGASDYYEERPAAREVARFLGTDHTEISLDEASCLRSLPEIFAGLDEPFADSSVIPSFAVARETRKHVTVALSGDGADELFGGYRKHQGELYAAWYRAIPPALRRLVVDGGLARLSEGKDTRLGEVVRRVRRFAEHAAKDADARHAGWAQSMSESELDALLGPPPGAGGVEALVRSLRSPSLAGDPVNDMLDIDLKLVLPSDMLVKVDRMSMANGLEVRCPFLDPGVVDAALGLPGSMKVRPGRGKWVLRRAFASRLPREVFRRPKRGFEAPIARWLKGSLHDVLAATFDRVRLQRQGLLDPDVCEGWRRALESGRQDTSWKIWTVIAFQQWATVHGRSEAMS